MYEFGEPGLYAYRYGNFFTSISKEKKILYYALCVFL